MITMDDLVTALAPTAEEKAAMDKEAIALMNSIYKKHMGSFPPVPDTVWEEMIAATVALATEKTKAKLAKK